jgi:hypothetical protein
VISDWWEVRGERPLSEVLARRIGFGRARLRCGRKAFAGAKALEYGCVQRRLVAEPSGWGLNAGIWARLAGKARYKTRTPLNRAKRWNRLGEFLGPINQRRSRSAREAVVRSFGSLALPKESSPITSTFLLLGRRPFLLGGRTFIMTFRNRRWRDVACGVRLGGTGQLWSWFWDRGSLPVLGGGWL